MMRDTAAPCAVQRRATRTLSRGRPFDGVESLIEAGGTLADDRAGYGTFCARAVEDESVVSGPLALDIATGRRVATDDEAERLRRHFGEGVLPRQVTSLVLRKYSAHVEENGEWPRDTIPEEYLESLREIVLDDRSGLFLEYSEEEDDWTIYFTGRVRRRWRGPTSDGLIVVLFNVNRVIWITGFQPEGGLQYLDERDGYWARGQR